MLNATRTLALRLLLLAIIPVVGLGGCGVYTPEKGLLQSDDVEPPNPSPQGMYEYNVVKHIQCELRVGVWRASQLPNSGWIKHAGGLATLKLVVQDQSSLNPSASFLQTFGLKAAESFTLGIGGTGSANATRTETMAFSYSSGELYKEALVDVAHGITDCQGLQRGVLIDSNLKIGQFIYDKIVAEGAGGPESKQFSGLQFEINFVASFSANITPTWKFTTTTVNGSGTLFGATRTDTDDLIITLGPVNGNTAALHNAAVIGSAVAGANQSFSH